MENSTFLRAEWRNLLMLNYEVDPAVLTPYIPPGTELDLWQGKTLVSMVGFNFVQTRVLGVKWPWHTNFEEVNLRFYVRRFDGTQWKRGAVFVSEIVPLPIVTIIANSLYNERYSFRRMRHSITPSAHDTTSLRFEWKNNGRWNSLGGTVENTFRPMPHNSPESFIFEHYWGYNKLSEHMSHEYQVEHPSWQIATVRDSFFDADIADSYGPEFVPFLSKAPYSAFYAAGSPVSIRIAGKIHDNVPH